MFCGHFHTAPTQILTGEVRVEIRPSDPTQGFHVLGCSYGGHGWEGLHLTGIPPSQA